MPVPWLLPLLLLLLVHPLTCVTTNIANAPLIGILSVPYDERQSYIPASYVKWIESGGGRVIPITLGLNQTEIQSLINQLNGVLFTGGSASFNYSDDNSGYYWASVNWILDYLRQITRNSEGAQIVPLWGSCLGFEAVLSATAKGGTSEMVTDLDAYHLPLNISFTSAATGEDCPMFGSDSKMNEGYKQYSYTAFATQNASYNDHQNGFLPESLVNDEYLSGNFTSLGTSKDRNNVEFVALVQSKPELNLHWSLAQFHPEKEAYSFDAEKMYNLPHTLSAVLANQYLAQFFINQCRLYNTHRMESGVYWDSVIYNYSPIFTSKLDPNSSYFEQIYFFDY